MERVLETSGPVASFTDAVHARDVNRIAGLLAHDVRLSVPPLHYVRRGSQDVITAIVGLFRSFGELDYDARSRYVAPGTVTDEVMFTGNQTAPFLGAVPSGRPSMIAARVILTHDVATVTGIVVWPDLAALRTAVGGTSRIIDLTGVGEAGAMVASLRATIPPAQAKLIIGSAREDRPVPAAVTGPAEPLAPLGAEPHPLAGRAIPKPPVPRQVRRRRAMLAGGAMSAVSAALAAWVTVGALNAPAGSASGRGVQFRQVAGVAGGSAGTADAARRPGAAGDGSAGDGSAGDGSAAGAGAGATDGGAVGAQGPDGAGGDGTPGFGEAAPSGSRLTATRNEVSFSSDVLFDTGSARLRPKAQHILDTLVQDARLQGRHGLVRVNGYTDDVGAARYNLRLSQQRAAAVARVLRTRLAGTGMTFAAKGYGETHPVVRNTSGGNRQRNRRVTIAFQPAAAPGVASASASAAAPAVR